ncbi:MAG: 50S ribosomal protein L27 [Candidatus Buchananbacteria bacterium]
MAHKKAGASTSLGRDSQSKRLGVKLYGAEYAKAGSIIVRQRGSKIRPGKNTLLGSDDTIFSTITGKVKFTTKTKINFDGSRKKRPVVSVEPLT